MFRAKYRNNIDKLIYMDGYYFDRSTMAVEDFFIRDLINKPNLEGFYGEKVYKAQDLKDNNMNSSRPLNEQDTIDMGQNKLRLNENKKYRHDNIQLNEEDTLDVGKLENERYGGIKTDENNNEHVNDNVNKFITEKSTKDSIVTNTAGFNNERRGTKESNAVLNTSVRNNNLQNEQISEENESEGDDDEEHEDNIHNNHNKDPEVEEGERKKLKITGSQFLTIREEEEEKGVDLGKKKSMFKHEKLKDSGVNTNKQSQEQVIADDAVSDYKSTDINFAKPVKVETNNNKEEEKILEKKNTILSDNEPVVKPVKKKKQRLLNKVSVVKKHSIVDNLSKRNSLTSNNILLSNADNNPKTGNNEDLQQSQAVVNKTLSKSNLQESSKYQASQQEAPGKAEFIHNNNNIVMNNNFLSGGGEENTNNVNTGDQLNTGADRKDIEERIKNTTITLNDYDRLKAKEAVYFDRRSFMKYFRDEMIRNHSLLGVFIKFSIVNPSYIRVFKLFVMFNMIYGFNAIVYTDDYIDLLAENQTVKFIKTRFSISLQPFQECY
jgi:hypothetical protein